MTEYTDVVIVGAGPAGLMASLSLSAMGIKHQIIDKLGTRALNGRADGFHVRTVEIWDSFGIAHKLEEHGSTFGEWALWTPGTQGIQRQRRESTIGSDVSHKRTGTFHQGYIEATLIGAIKARNGPTVQRGVQPTSFSISESEYPITLQVQRLDEAELEHWATNAHSLTTAGPQAERGWVQAFGDDVDETTPHVSGNGSKIIHAKYLIGTDGGHSWVRHQLPGFKMEGAASNSVWAVIDIVPITDFPDIRKNCTILSQRGTILIIPRENGLVRLYIQLNDGEKPDASLASALDAMRLAKDIFYPYTIDYRYCDWFTIYTVGQRVSNHFCYKNSVFLAGDAVHTHTPKGGQGMNVSQQDTYNLAWKIAGVLKGQLSPSVLSTYEAERRPLAKALVELDGDMAKVLTARSTMSETEVMKVYDRLRAYGSGVNICYRSALVAVRDHSTSLRLGHRMPQAPIVKQASGSEASIHALLKSDGLWRVFVFSGNLAEPDRLERVNQAGKALESTIGSNIARVLLVHSGSPRDCETTGLHKVYLPFSETTGYNYDTVFASNSESGTMPSSVYNSFGIDEDGAIVVVRPDQMIAWIGSFEEHKQLDEWLSSVMILHQQA